jgi:hypothetical protein
LIEILRQRLNALPDVDESASRFGYSLAWRAGSREIAHVHSDSIVDIRIPAARQRALARDDRLMPRSSRSDWIECRLSEPGDAEYAAALIAHAARCSREK